MQNQLDLPRSIKCPSCSAPTLKKIDFLNTSHPHAPQLTGLEIYVCEKCDLGFAYPYRSIEDMNDFYKNYYRAAGADHKFRPTRNLRKYPSFRVMAQWALCLPYIDRSKSIRVLDVGPGGTASAETTQLMGIKCEFHAVEPDKYSGQALQEMGVVLIQDSFHTRTSLPVATYDVIIMSHVLEHYSGSEVGGILNKLNTLMGSDSILMIEVPNAPMRTYGTLRSNDSPHLLFFSKKALISLLVKHGFEVIVCSEFREDYDQYWAREQKLLSLRQGEGKRGKLRALLRRYMPALLSLLRAFRRSSLWFRHQFKPAAGPYDLFRSQEFHYAERTTTLRLIAKAADH